MARTPPHVQRRTLRDGTARFRAWVQRDGRRAYGPWTDSAADAYRQAQTMRAADAALRDVVTLAAACDAVLAEAKAKRTAGTHRWYGDHFRALKLALGADRNLVGITAETLEQFVRDRLATVSAATVNADLRALHRVFAVAIRRGWAVGNPVRHVDRPRAVTPPMDWFTEAELATVVARVDDPVARDLMVVLFFTGLRRSELARVEREHVRRTQLVVAGKTGTRIVPLGEDAVDALARLPIPMTTKTIDDLFRAARRATGDRRLHPHALRHSFATALVRSGERPDVVMRLMGHRSLQTTLRYWHETGEDAARAVGRLRLVLPAAEPQREQGSSS